MKRLMMILACLAILLLSGVLAFRHFITNHTLDKDGMENPNAPDVPDALQILDGDFTYVDNEALLDQIEGTWKSADGRYVLTLHRDYRAVLVLDGDTVLDTGMNFTYLQPGFVSKTEFQLDECTLSQANSGAFGEIEAFFHQAGDSGSRIVLQFTGADGSCGTVEFQKEAGAE